MRFTTITLFLGFCFLFHGTTNAQVVINEIMSNNLSTVLDEDGEYHDWIELYNTSSSSVSLSNWHISDDPDTLDKWELPSISISGNGYLIIFCSGKDDDSGELHANFSIAKGGETIYLSNSSGAVVDNLSSLALPGDQSFGRVTDGNAIAGYLSFPTFDASNDGSTLVTGTINDVPFFSTPGGVYTTPQIVALSHPDTACVIRYTLDGSEPTENSPLYTAPILLQSRANDTNYYSMIRTGWANHSYLTDWQPPVGNVFKVNVLRARAFKTGYYAGPIQTYTYFIDPNMPTRYGTLPLVSVVSDPKHLFNDTTGIYVPGVTYALDGEHGNYHNGWTKPANIEMYYPDGRSCFNGNFAISIGGESSHSNPQKGLNVTASENYGPSKIDYPIFENTPGKARYIQSFDKIKLRAWGTARRKGLIQDGYCNSYMTETDIDYAAYQPCVVFIDGEYWGLQEIRERNRNSNYYEEHYFIDKDNPGFDILDGGDNTVDEGDAVHWDAMTDFIDTHPMNDSTNYAYVKTQMDVKNYMLYNVFSIFLGRGDWPDQNEAKWRARIPGSKWKWIQWDMDNCVGNNLSPWSDMFEQVLIGTPYYGPAPLLVQLLDNDEFKRDFINVNADWMNTYFIPALSIARLDSIADQLRPYFSEFQDRYQMNYTWEDRLDSGKWFLERRPKYCRRHIMEHFYLPDTLSLTIDVSDTAKGNVRVNTILLNESTPRITAATYPWRGVYFHSNPVPLQAIPKPGYRFLHWLPTMDTNASILYTPLTDYSLTAVFDVDPNYVARALPVVNEVMSGNASAVADNYGEYDDWVEIYNANADTLDIGGYFLTDNLALPTRFQVATGNDSTKIPPRGHLLIWLDDDTEQGVLHANFKIKATGDFLALTDKDGRTLIDSVRFGAMPPDQSYGCRYDGADSYTLFTVSTPQAPNWKVTETNILINELQTVNTTTITDDYGDYDAWIELYNPGSDTVDVSGWTLSYDGSPATTYQLPYDNAACLLSPGAHQLIWTDATPAQGDFHAPFALAAAGCLSLYKPDRAVSDSICHGTIPADHAYGRRYDGAMTWILFPVPTPAATNWLFTAQTVMINEVQTQNTTTAFDNYGEAEPWVELFNPNADTIDLAGWKLRHRLVAQQEFVFANGNDSTLLPPYAHRLVWFDGEVQEGLLHAEFQLPATGCLELVKPNAVMADTLCYAAMMADASVGRRYDGAPVLIDFTIPTPESTNWLVTTAPVYINELQSQNISTISDNAGDYDRWLELYNGGSDTVDLAGWSITRSAGVLFTFEYGNDSTKLAPMDHMVVWSDAESNEGFNHMNFVFDPTDCLTLWRPNQTQADSICGVPTLADESYGRFTDGANNWIIFTVATPDSNNVVSTAGIDWMSGSDGLQFYPNPVEGNMVYCNKAIHFVLTDPLGRILQRNYAADKIDFTGLTAGVYFVRLDNNLTYKIIKK